MLVRCWGYLDTQTIMFSLYLYGDTGHVHTGYLLAGAANYNA